MVGIWLFGKRQRGASAEGGHLAHPEGGHPEEEALALDQFPQKQAKEEMKTVLGNFCFSVLDDHEDGIVGLLKQEDWAGERERQDFLDAFTALVLPKCQGVKADEKEL